MSVGFGIILWHRGAGRVRADLVFFSVSMRCFMHVYMLACVWVFMYGCICICMSVYVCVCVYMCLYLLVFTCVCVCLYVFLYFSLCVCLYKCVCLCRQVRKTVSVLVDVNVTYLMNAC